MKSNYGGGPPARRAIVRPIVDFHKTDPYLRSCRHVLDRPRPDQGTVTGGGPAPVGFVRRPAECVGLMMIAEQSRILRIHVPGWVLDDRSGAVPVIGEIVEELLTFVDSCRHPSPDDTPIRAVARPRYGHGPGDHPDWGMQWPFELTGDGWSAGWWSDRPRSGPVELTGRLVVDIGTGGDGPVAVRGRVCRIRGLTGNGYTATGIVVDLDLDDVPAPGDPGFVPGSVSIGGTDVWVVDRSKPILLHVDTSIEPYAVTDYLMPLPIESPSLGPVRQVIADDWGCWITSYHDVHRCDRSADGTLAVKRVSVTGGGGVLVDGRLIVSTATTPMLMGDPRHGLVRKDPERHPVQAFDRDGTVTFIDDPEEQARLKPNYRNTNRPRITDTRNPAEGHLTIVLPSGTDLTLDVRERVRGTVRWIQTDPFSDPANVALVPMLSVDSLRPARGVPGRPAQG